MVSSPRSPSSTIRIFSSALCCRRVWRRMSFTVASADTFLPISLLLYVIQWVESLSYSNLSPCPSGSETKQIGDHDPQSLETTSLRQPLVDLQYFEYRRCTSAGHPE